MPDRNDVFLNSFAEESILPRTGERYIPGESRVTGIESMHRYAVAAELVAGRRVLDIASGEGYGSFMLSQKAASVVGVDLNRQAVEAAKAKYRKENLTFLCADAVAVPLPDHSFDSIVSFESIEHIPSPASFLKELHRLLVPGGLLIISSPNKSPFDAYHGKDVNDFHINELEQAELEEMLNGLFQHNRVFSQNAFFNSIITGDGQPEFFVQTPQKDIVRQSSLRDTQYSFVLASDGELPRIPYSCYLDAYYDAGKGYYEDDEAVINQFGIRGEILKKTEENEKLSGDLKEECAKSEYLYGELKSAEKRQEENREKIHSLQEDKDRLFKHIATVDEFLAEKKIQLGDLLKEKERLLLDNSALNQKLAVAEKQRSELQTALAECGKELENMRNAERDCHLEVKSKTDKINEIEYVNSVLKYENHGLRSHISFMESKCASLENEIGALKNSRAFRWMRRYCDFTGSIVQRTCRFLYRILKAGDKLLPLRYHTREQLKLWVYGHFGAAFRNMKNYQEFMRQQELKKYLCPDADTGLRIPGDMPLTSVIIPVYNNLKLTVKCLNSIYSAGTGVPFEVILVDDASKENIRSLMHDFPGIRVIRNESNLGFLRTANRGAKEARGEYLLFLNNDTEVLPGWLDELAVALYHHPEAGMIGSQLIHLHTGRLQESGNLICGNGEIIPLGRGIDPMHPEFTYFREVDFSSAASIIVSRRRFESVGGFDPVYIPAYFEDPDLALKFRKNGWKNYVMPLSKVLHHEMASYGDTLNTGCEKNRRTFLARWSAYLRENSLYGSVDEMRRAYRFSRPRVLYIDAEVPMADRGSGGMDAVFFMEYMVKRGYDVVFHGEYTPGYVGKYTAILLRAGVECVYAPQRRIWEYIRDNGRTFDYVFVSRVYQAQCFDRLIRRYAPQAAYIFDTVDVHFVRERREAELSHSEEKMRRALMTEKLEITLMARADMTIVISSDEKKMLEEQYGMKRIRHIPQARKVFGCRESFREREGIVFIGSAHPPNLDALKFYVEEILPALEKRGIDGTLDVIGEALRNDIFKKKEYQCVAESPKIRFLGFVENLGDCLDHAKITVAPLRYGAGTKGKVASSMAYGVPCVSSCFGTEGTGMKDRENIMIASSPEEYAEAIAALMTDEDLWKKISCNGIRFLQQNYAPDAIERQMDSLFAEAKEHKIRLDGLLRPLETGRALAEAARSPLSAKTAVSAEQLALAAFRCCQPHDGAAVFMERTAEDMRKELASFGQVRFGETVLAESGKFDYIVLPLSARHPQRLKCELEHSLRLLYDGSRVFFTVPRKEFDHEQFFACLVNELKYQQVFLAAPLPGECAECCCLCAVKAIPREGEVTDEV